MCTYLKNMEGYKLKDLKLKEFDSIQEMFDRAFKRVNTFEDFRTELVEGKEKRCLEIIPDKEEVTIDVIPLAVKSPSIIGWKIHKEGRKSYYQIMRADGKSQMYMIFSHMLKSFNREDLYKLVKAKYKSTRPVEDLDLLLWGDLKTMFEPHVEDKVWRNQQEYKVLDWKLYDSCRVHSLRMQHMQIYMLVEKKYPLAPLTLLMMLEKKLIIDYESEMAYQLLKFIIKQLKKIVSRQMRKASWIVMVCLGADQSERERSRGWSPKLLALRWLLEEIHVTWAQLEKKRTRPRLYTNYLEEIPNTGWRRRRKHKATASGSFKRRRQGFPDGVRTFIEGHTPEGVGLRVADSHTASDLEELHQNPELFHHEQDAVLWSEKLRPCAEALYIVLFHNHSQVGPVVSILQEAMNGCPPSITDITSRLLLKDDAYGERVIGSMGCGKWVWGTGKCTREVVWPCKPWERGGLGLAGKVEVQLWYFVLTASDLEEWHQNPELFHHEKDAVLWSEKLRACAEALYIVLFHNHSQLLGLVVVSILQEAMNGCPPSVTDITLGLLLKDAAYDAVAYIYYELSNYLSFKDWFNNALSLEFTNDHPNMRIIHRKVALILDQWVSEIKDDTKRPVYCVLIKLLHDRDLCVRSVGIGLLNWLRMYRSLTLRLMANAKKPSLDFLWHPRFEPFVSSVVVNVAAVVVIGSAVVVIAAVIVVAVVVESLVGLAKVRFYRSW
ncbi:putative ribonuclease H-like domain-containing protein [Tanacetum coccineum]